MPNFDSPAALLEEAFALYIEGKSSAAALKCALGREAARTLGDHATAFQAGFWEALARSEEGDLGRALGLLFSLLSDVPPDAPAYERWQAQLSCLSIQLTLRPERARLRRLLADLDTLAARQAAPASDLHSCRGQLAFYQGEWEQALGHYARGWQAHDGSGVVKHAFAWGSIQCCLRLDRRQEAESWWQHLAVTNQDQWDQARVMLKAATLLRALDAGDHAAAGLCVDNGCGSNEHELRAQLFLRGASLDPLHDPGDPSHPARKLAAMARQQNVQARYDKLLALVDYRLACLRFTAGLPAVDDLYYRQPDVLPRRIKLADPAKFQQQKRSFDFSWHLLRRHARRIDALLECDWRTQEANSRRQRCDAIVAACQPSLKKGK